MIGSSGTLALLVVLLAASLSLEARRRSMVRTRRLSDLLGLRSERVSGEVESLIARSRRLTASDSALGRMVFAIAGAASVGLLATPLLAPVGAVLGSLIPPLLARRREAKHEELVERQLAEVTEAVALAVRSGFAVGQGLEFAISESERPLRDKLEEMLEARRLGVPFDVALEQFGRSVGSDDARLLVMILGIHHKTGGNVANALAEVAKTVRDRVSVRRELRALTAQGRISGTILGGLPVAFFAVMAVTSRQEIAEVVASLAGATMVGLGLAMNAVAYLWIRSLLRVAV